MDVIVLNCYMSTLKEIFGALLNWIYLALFGIVVGLPVAISYLGIGYFLPNEWYGHPLHFVATAVVWSILVITIVPRSRDWFK